MCDIFGYLLFLFMCMTIIFYLSLINVVVYVMLYAIPLYSCGFRLDPEVLQNVYAMAFAVEEINRNNILLPGVKLGYRIFDSCVRYPWALQAALSLVAGDEHSCNVTASTSRTAADDQPGETAGIT